MILSWVQTVFFPADITKEFPAQQAWGLWRKWRAKRPSFPGTAACLSWLDTSEPRTAPQQAFGTHWKTSEATSDGRPLLTWPSDDAAMTSGHCKPYRDYGTHFGYLETHYIRFHFSPVPLPNHSNIYSSSKWCTILLHSNPIYFYSHFLYFACQGILFVLTDSISPIHILPINFGKKISNLSSNPPTIWDWWSILTWV